MKVAGPQPRDLVHTELDQSLGLLIKWWQRGLRNSRHTGLQSMKRQYYNAVNTALVPTTPGPGPAAPLLKDHSASAAPNR
ncbi:hypothetical protein [Arthrobacter monumenti]